MVTSDRVVSQGTEFNLKRGDTAYNSVVDGGLLTVSSGGRTVGTTVTNNGLQVVYSGASAQATSATANGLQEVVGYASGTVLEGGVQKVYNTGRAYDTVVNAGGIHSLFAGTASNTMINGGSEYIGNEGLSVKATVNTGGVQTIQESGLATSTTLQATGSQFVYGSAFRTTINGGQQTVYGKVTSTTINENGVQTVSGSAATTVVNSGGLQDILDGSATTVTVNTGGFLDIGGTSGVAKKITVNSGGVATLVPFVATGVPVVPGTEVNTSQNTLASGVTINSSGAFYAQAGSAVNVAVKNGGSLWVRAYANTVTVSSGGSMMLEGHVNKLTVKKGGILETVSSVEVAGVDSTPIISAKLTSATIQSGASVTVVSGTSMAGKNSVTGATVSGGALVIASGAQLSLGNKAKINTSSLTISSATLRLTGSGATVKSLSMDAKSKVNYVVSGLAAKNNTLMLSLSKANSQKKGTFTVTTAKNQAIGVYELSQNIIQKENTSYTVNQGSTKLGTATLDGSTLKKYGMTYKIQTVGDEIRLNVGMAAGSMYKGSTKADTLKGTANSDIFYGGKGNDTINGNNGRDVVIYDKTAWGKDVINQTSGTMTILIKDLSSSAIQTKLKNTTMTITRKNTSQTVTVKGWDSATHSIVYGGTMSSYATYLKAASPTSAVTSAARAEVWKKAGLVKA